MGTLECDFWGLSQSSEFIDHLQSFYIVFRSKAIINEGFKKFWNYVSTVTDKNAVIKKYELLLTCWLEIYGLKAASYISHINLQQDNISPVHMYWRQLLRHKNFPCIKRDILLERQPWFITSKWESELCNAGYPVHYIKNYINRIHNFKH